MYSELKTKLLILNSQDLLFNPEQSNGYLFEKLRYMKRKKNTDRCDTNNVTAPLNVNESIQEISWFFKNCVLPKDKNQIIEKFEQTIEIRRYSLKNDRIIFDNSIHLYLVCPELVVIIIYYFFYHINN